MADRSDSGPGFVGPVSLSDRSPSGSWSQPVMKLDHEVGVYLSHLLDLLGDSLENEGKFTAIRGDEIIGPFDDYEAALEGAYTRFGLGGFLVKQIHRVEPVLEFTRDLR